MLCLLFMRSRRTRQSSPLSSQNANSVRSLINAEFHRKCLFCISYRDGWLFGFLIWMQKNYFLHRLAYQGKKLFTNFTMCNSVGWRREIHFFSSGIKFAHWSLSQLISKRFLVLKWLLFCQEKQNVRSASLMTWYC